MKTKRFLLLLSPPIILPIAVVAIGLGMSDMIVVIALAIYAVLLLKALAQ